MKILNDSKFSAMIEQVWFVLFCSVVFLASVKVTGFQYFEIPKAGIIALLFIFSGILIFKRVTLDMSFIFLFEALFFVAFKENLGLQFYDVPFFYIAVASYFLPKLIIIGNRNKGTTRTWYMYITIMLGTYVGGMIEAIYNKKIGYFNTEIYISPWTKEEHTRCLYEIYFVLITSSIFAIVLLFNIDIRIKIVVVLLQILALYETITHEGRLNLFMLILTVPLLLALYLIDKRKEIGKKTKTVLLTGIIMFFLLSILIYIIVAINLFNLGDVYKKSFLAGSGGIIHNVRFEIYRQVFPKLADYPHGNITEIHKWATHNLWLKYHNYHGLQVSVLLMLFALTSLIDAIRLVFIKNTWNIKYILVSSLVMLDLYYFLDGNGYDFRFGPMLLFFVAGLIRGNLENAYSENKLIITKGLGDKIVK